MTRWIGIVFIVLAAGAWPAAGHEGEFTAEQKEALRAHKKRLRKIVRSGRLTPKKAATFDFEEFKTHDLEHVLSTVKEDEEPRLRDALARVCRMVVLRRSPVGKLQKASEICFLLASPRNADWVKSDRLMRREPLGNDLDRAVIALGRDARPEVRLVAVKLATTLLFFGRKSEGLLATVLAGISDKHPNVAAASAYGAVATRDKRVVDRMVACLSDTRALDTRASPVLNWGWKSVSGFLVPTLCWMIRMERFARRGLRARIAGRWASLPDTVRLGPDEIRTWWKKNRDMFGFEVPAPMYKRIFDGVLVLTLHKPVVVRLAEGTPLRITLKQYREGWHDGKPISWIEAALTDIRFPKHERELTSLGNPAESDWAIKGMGSDWQVETADGRMANGSIACKAAFLPTYRRGRVRMKLVIHLEHE